MLDGLVAPGLVRDSVDTGRQVREDESFDLSLLRDAADFLDRRMIGLHVLHVSVESSLAHPSRSGPVYRLPAPACTSPRARACRRLWPTAPPFRAARCRPKT